MLVDMGVALFAFGILALALRHFPLAVAAFGIAFYLVS